jgi:hypothetical protein
LLLTPVAALLFVFVARPDLYRAFVGRLLPAENPTEVSDEQQDTMHVVDASPSVRTPSAIAEKPSPAPQSIASTDDAPNSDPPMDAANPSRSAAIESPPPTTVRDPIREPPETSVVEVAPAPMTELPKAAAEFYVRSTLFLLSLNDID